MSAVNLTALAEARAKMTPGACGLDEDGALPGWLGDVGSLADRAGLVATHNAADVLIEVARAALLVSETKRKYLDAGMLSAMSPHWHAYRDAISAFERSLAKVTL